jgi:hypothetical protein
MGWIGLTFGRGVAVALGGQGKRLNFYVVIFVNFVNHFYIRFTRGSVLQVVFFGRGGFEILIIYTYINFLKFQHLKGTTKVNYNWFLTSVNTLKLYSARSRENFEQFLW